MKLFIPELGTQLKLTKDWRISVMNERRNYSLLDAFTDSSNQLIRKAERLQYEICGWQKTEINEENKRHYYPNYGLSWDEAVEFYNKYRHLIDSKKPWNTHEEITIPKGTILEIDRIYIRQGNAGCSSVTFKIRAKKVLRFWASLEQVNNIECQIVGGPTENRYKNIPRAPIGG